MAGTSTIADYAGFLKRQQTIAFIYDQAVRLMDFAKNFLAKPEDILGQGMMIPVITRGGRNAVGFREERGPLPDPEIVKSILGRARVHYGWAYLDTTEQQIRASAGKDGAWERIQAVEIYNKAQELGHYINQAAFRDGTARIAKVGTVTNVGATDQKWELQDAGGSPYAPLLQDNLGAVFLKEGDIVALAIPGATGSTRAGSTKIKEVNLDVTPNYVIVEDRLTAAAANDYVVRCGHYDPAGATFPAATVVKNTGVPVGSGTGENEGSGIKEPEGLMRWFTDAGPAEFATSMGNPVSIPTDQFWKGFVRDFSGSPVLLNLEDFTVAKSTVGRRGGAEITDVWTSWGIADDLAIRLFVPAQEFMNTNQARNVGFVDGTLSINGIKINKSIDGLPGHMFFYNSRCLHGAQQGPPAWIGSPGQILNLVPTTTGVYEAILTFPFNVFTTRRNRGGLIKGIKEVTPVREASSPVVTPD